MSYMNSDNCAFIFDCLESLFKLRFKKLWNNSHSFAVMVVVFFLEFQECLSFIL